MRLNWGKTRREKLERVEGKGNTARGLKRKKSLGVGGGTEETIKNEVYSKNTFRGRR